jgi:FkbM family methyltransferase
LVISSENKTITFYETLNNESGSILSNHINIKNDQIKKYTVESLNLKGLLARTGYQKIDYLKLDIEGAEYDLVKESEIQVLHAFKQIFIEFHHHAIDHYNQKDTKQIVNFLAGKGFHTFTLDDHNYLFYR